MNSLSALHSGFITRTPTGLRFDPDTPYSEWETIGRILWQMSQWVNFAVGDWVNFGERTYGEIYAQALDTTGWDYQRIADCAWVARNVPVSVRNENLSWTHHRYVARFSGDEAIQARLLDHAEVFGLTTREFKRDVLELYPLDTANGDRAPALPDVIEVCPACGQVIPHEMLDN